jgi:hypothetical protein
MKKITNTEKNIAKMEKRKLKLESGLISEHYPEIESICIKIKNSYGKKNPITIARDFRFLPDSHAYFTVECLNKNCADGGFDLAKTIISMIKNRKLSKEGELHCNGTNLPPDHSHISYKITINYNKKKGK